MADINSTLLAAIEARIALQGLPAALCSSSFQRWSSATFTGARYQWAFDCFGCDVAALNKSLTDDEIGIPGALIADIQAVSHTGGFTVEALVVDEK